MRTDRRQLLQRRHLPIASRRIPHYAGLPLPRVLDIHSALGEYSTAQLLRPRRPLPHMWGADFTALSLSRIRIRGAVCLVVVEVESESALRDICPAELSPASGGSDRFRPSDHPQ